MAVGASPAAAQRYIGRDSPHAGSLEASGSITWSRGYDAGGKSALETPNTTSGAPPLTLFTATSKVATTTGLDSRLGIYLGRQVSAEVSFQYSRPVLSSSLANDFENAAPIVAEQRLSSYVAGGSILYHFRAGRLVPFAMAGGGYLRYLYEENALVITGTEIHGGGGIKYWFSNSAHRFGLRLDAAASSRSKNIGFEDKRRVVPVVGVGLVYLF